MNELHAWRGGRPQGWPARTEWSCTLCACRIPSSTHRWDHQIHMPEPNTVLVRRSTIPWEPRTAHAVHGGLSTYWIDGGCHGAEVQDCGRRVGEPTWCAARTCSLPMTVIRRAAASGDPSTSSWHCSLNGERGSSPQAAPVVRCALFCGEGPDPNPERAAPAVGRRVRPARPAGARTGSRARRLRATRGRSRRSPRSSATAAASARGGRRRARRGRAARWA